MSGNVVRTLMRSHFPWKPQLSQVTRVESPGGGADVSDISIITHISSPGVMGISLKDRHGEPVLGRTPARRATEGCLDSITPSRIKLELLASFDPPVFELLKPLWDPKAFEDQILRYGIPVGARRDRISAMGKHLGDMYKFGIVKPARAPLLIMKLFTVLKKNGNLRLIQDCRPLNELCHKPPRMPLDSIHTFIRRILAAEYVGTSDGKSFFYQFSLGDDIRKFFGCKVRKGRGHHTTVAMTSLPMGFSWAPFFAQSFANSLIKDLGMAWVDNFIIMGNSIEEYNRKKAEFLTRAKLLNVQLDDDDPQPCRKIELLGIEFNLETKTYRLAPDFITKAVDRLSKAMEEGPRDIISLLEAIGSVVWFCYVTQTPLCHFPHMMETLRAMAQKAWSGSHRVSEDTRKEFAFLLRTIAHNESREPRPEFAAEVSVEADAATSQAAYIIYQGETILSAKQRSTAYEHIFLNELDIAVEGILKAHSLGFRGIAFRGDNMACLVALQKRLSSNFKANRILAKLPRQITVETTYVNTHENLADPFTRGIKLPHTERGMDAIRKLHELFNSAQEVMGPRRS